MVQLSNFVKQNRAQPGDRPQDNAPSQMDFAQLQAAVLPGLQNLRNYFEGQQDRSLTEDEQADLDRLDDQYLGLHLMPDSTNTELFEYQRAQDQLQSQRAVRYREMNDLSNSLLERISRKNLSDPDSVRSSIRRINRIYSVLGLSQEAGLLTGQDYSLAHREQMKQDAFSQTSQVTDSVWEEFAKNRGIKTLGRP